MLSKTIISLIETIAILIVLATFFAFGIYGLFGLVFLLVAWQVKFRLGHGYWMQGIDH